MRLFIAASAALVLASAAAFADGDPVASRYGNTMIAKTADGIVAHMYYNADHSFTGRVVTGSKGMQDIKLKGTWKLEYGKFCVSYDPPQPGMTNPTCYPLDTHKVGDTWTSGDSTVTLVEGIQ